MLTPSVLAGLTCLPLLAALLAAAAGRTRPGRALDLAAGAALATAAAALAAGLAVAAGADLVLRVDGQPWFRVDALGAVLAPVLAVVATTVLVYARRNLDGDRVAWRFASGATVLLAATMVVLTAARLDVLVAGWVVGTVATVALCGYRGDPGARTARRRAAQALGLGDLALLGGLLVLVLTARDLDLDRLGEGAAGAWAPVVAGLVVVAALARAGQLPLPRWLPSTVAAPTPVSALLHAGAVNAGAVLLVRTTPLVAPQRAAMVGLAVAAAATVVVSWSTMRTRPDVKGELAASTGAQMGFMLLALAAGAPVAALTHLAGHALYKSARFLGAGDDLARRVAARRWAPASLGRRAGPWTVGAVVAGATAAAWWWLSGTGDGAAAAERWWIALALAAAAGRGAATVASQPLGVARPLAARTALTVTAALAVVWVAHLALHGATAHPDGFVPPIPLLVVVAGALLAHAAVQRHPHVALRLAGPRPAVPVRARPPQPGPPVAATGRGPVALEAA